MHVRRLILYDFFFHPKSDFFFLILYALVKMFFDLLAQQLILSLNYSQIFY